MKVSIERKRPMEKKLFGGVKEADQVTAPRIVWFVFVPQRGGRPLV
jgi:hypothetical protein